MSAFVHGASRLALLCCVWAAAAAGPAAAAGAEQNGSLLDAPLEDLLAITVSGASRFEQPVSEAPASVSVVTAETIRLYGYRTLADIIRSQRGMFVSDDRNYSYAGMRGFGRSGDYNTRLLVLVDGHRINDNSYDSVGIGHDFIVDVDLIDRVEIIRGPASSLYGNNAFFGVVNVVTRQARGLSGSELSAEAGGLETYKGRISYGRRFSNDLRLSVSGSYLDSAGDRRLYYPEFAAVNNGIARNLDGERSGSLLATAAWRELTLQAAYVDRRKDIPTASYGTDFNRSPNLTNDRRGYLSLRYERAFAEDGKMQARIYYDHADYYSDSSNFGQFSGVLRDESYNNSIGSELQVSWLLPAGHRLTGGINGTLNRVAFKVRNITTAVADLNTARDTSYWSGFVQDEFTIVPGLILSSGLRYDHFDSFGGELSPRGALIYSPLPQSTFKLVYGEAFRAPLNYEMYFTSPLYSIQGNPGLKHEKIRSAELIYEQQFLSRHRLTLSGFYNELSNMIAAVDDGGISRFRNLDRIRTAGWEGELEGGLEGGVTGRISYSYRDFLGGSTGQVPGCSPRHMVKGGLAVPLFNNSVIPGLEVQYMSSRSTAAGSRIGEYAVTNLTLLSRTLMTGLELSTGVYNLFDRRYADPASIDHTQDRIAQNGITWRVKAVYSF